MQATGVIINNCYGGFSFSHAFAQFLFARHPPHTPAGEAIFDIEPFDDILAENVKYGTPITFVPHPDMPEGYHIGAFGEEAASRYFCNSEKTKCYALYNQERLRTNQDVVRCLEEYGPRQASGIFSSLSIFYVPTGFKYSIRDYDGMETVICTPPFEDICLDLLDHIALPERGRFRTVYTQDLIDGKITMDSLRRWVIEGGS